MKFLRFLFVFIVGFSLFAPSMAAEPSPLPSEPSEAVEPIPTPLPVVVPSEPPTEGEWGYLPPAEFFSVVGEDYEVSLYAVQSEPNTPVTSSSGLKGILLDLFGPYMPTITQLTYRQGSNQYYTYVNDISPDFPWLCSAGIFALIIFCLFRMGGSLLCKQ